ncbi:MAG TPA: AAA family ATPase, partial [Tepidisphaeraceae bacterium]|nr:AAA family ATPase [Tepidisphaeraceae bacterium]
EVEAVHAKPDRLADVLARFAKETLRQLPPLEVHRRLLGREPEAREVIVEVEPARSAAPGWREPVRLRFHVLRWRHGEEAWVAYVPALDIEVVSPREDELDALIPKHILFSLGRTKAAARLMDLVQLARVGAVHVERREVTPEIRTPAQIEAESEKEEEPKPVIGDVGDDLSKRELPRAYEAGPTVERIADALGGRTGRSVLLIGPSGAGKTAAVHELFRQNRFRTDTGVAPLWATSGARLVAGMTGFGMWQERCQRLVREAGKAGAVVHLGSLIELMEVGKAGGSGFGIASFLRPSLARGDFLAIAECTPEQLTLVEKNNPHLLGVFQQVRVDEPGPGVSKAILLSVAIEASAKLAEELRHRNPAVPSTAIAEEAIDATDRLHRRYATYSAAPGRPIRFLKNLLADHFGGEPGASPVGAVSPEDVTRAFARETGLPRFLLEDSERLDLSAARAFFESRVMGQPEAVGLVTDLLATVKAGLNRPRRPIASLLFIGPTGVGKTEMAKALAEYFFGDRSRMARFDMSEFASPSAVARLVGTAWGTEGLLTSKVREQPFCVVLLDEFEKAHPAFFDLLLQVLGEGRLTDSAGRLADFSNAIVVMTSNLGAQSYQSGRFGLVAASARDAGREAREHFTDAVRDFLRPEMFNRIDRVVPFLPLGEETIRQIARREIDLIARRDGVLRRDVRLEVSDAAVAALAQTGFDALYGARPLKRAVERDLLAPLADAVNAYAGTQGLAATVDVVAGGRIAVDVRAVPANEAAGDAGQSALWARRSSALRRDAQAVGRCSGVMAVRNEVYQIERLLLRKGAHPGRRFIDPAHRDRLARIKAIADELGNLARASVDIEDAVLAHVYEATPLPYDPAELYRRLDEGRSAYDRLLLDLYALRWEDPNWAVVGLYGAAHADVLALARAYYRLAGQHGAEVGVSWFARVGKTGVVHYGVEAKDVDAFLSSPRSGVIGVVLGIRGPFAIARFEPEGGLHVFEREKGKDPHAVWVDVSAIPVREYAPPDGVEFRATAVGQRRRTYVTEQSVATDPVVGGEYRWGNQTFHAAVGEAIGDRLAALIKGVLDG